MPGYEKCMLEQQALGRAAGKFSIDYSQVTHIDGVTAFSGYRSLEERSPITALFKEGNAVQTLTEGDEGIIVLSQTPFYAESGGQVGDTGYLSTVNGTARFEVLDCQKNGDNHLHIGRVLSGEITASDEAIAQVDSRVRQATALNHSATHLLHAALREVLGDHVTQKGSLVDSEKLRFDFSHPTAIDHEQLVAIEQSVNNEIQRNTPVETQLCDMEQAKAKGAMMLFGEKYGDEVRVLSMGDGFSVELCGGIHVQQTGDIGLIHIVSESGIASGVRRIEAVTGQNALRYYAQVEQRLSQAADLLKSNPDNVLEKIQQLLLQAKAQEKTLAALQAKVASASSGDLLAHLKEVGDVQVLAHQVTGADAKTLRDMADALKSKLSNSVFLLVSGEGDKVSIIAGVTSDLTQRFKAGDLMRTVAPLVGGKGGGRPDMAQGGGTDPSGIPAVLAKVEEWITQ